MRKFFFLVYLLVTCSFANAQAQSKDDEFLANNPITALMIDPKEQSTDRLVKIKFSDGVEQSLKGPFEIVEDKTAQLRCPCKIYNLTFSERDGSRSTRQIQVELNKNSIGYIGSDGKDYKVNTARYVPRQAECVYSTDKTFIQLNTKSYAKDALKCENTGCIPSTTYICQAEVICRGHKDFSDYEGAVVCMQDTNGECPDVETCLYDKSTVPMSSSEKKRIDKRNQNSSQINKQ